MGIFGTEWAYIMLIGGFNHLEKYSHNEDIVRIPNILDSIPSGYLLHSHGKSPCLIGKPSISMGNFPWLC